MTRDVDIVALVDADHVNLILSVLTSEDLYVSAEDAKQAAERGGGSFNVIHLSSGGKVDIFVSGPGDLFTAARIARRQPADVFGVSTWVATAEDVVLAKLRWRLQSRSEVRWRDCVEIAKVQALDRDYLWRWAETLAISQDLGELLAEVDQSP